MLHTCVGIRHKVPPPDMAPLNMLKLHKADLPMKPYPTGSVIGPRHNAVNTANTIRSPEKATPILLDCMTTNIALQETVQYFWRILR